MIAKHIFRAYDIRGIYGKDFNEDGAKLIAKGYARYLRGKYPHKDSLTVVVSRDGRNSGPVLKSHFIDGLVESGIHVIDAGELPSPLLYFSVCTKGFDGGVSITASHNSAPYNGFKLLSGGAHSICGDELQKIWDIIQEKDFIDLENNGEYSSDHGTIKRLDIAEEYYSLLEEITDFSILKKKKISWKIGIDAGNGIAGAYYPEFFKRSGFEVVELYCDVNGNFPNHEADPEREENMADLKKLVIEKKLDFGLAYDGDGDRVGIVDRKGNSFSADLLLLLLARDILQKEENAGGAIVYDLKSTELLKEEIEKFGGKPVMCKTGHSFVEEEMEAHNALLGGEVSGHIFMSENYFGFDDALLASAKLLEIALQLEINEGKTFTDELGQLPQTFVTPEEKIPVSETKKFEILEKIVADLQERYPDAITIDGIRIEFGDNAWGIVRASNTSPYLTTRFEARSAEKLAEIKQIIMETIEKHM